MLDKNKIRKVQMSVDVKHIALRTGWDQDYVKRVLAVQENMLHGDQIEIHLTTTISLSFINRVIQLKAYHELIITLMERIIKQRAERLKDRVLYEKTA